MFNRTRSRSTRKMLSTRIICNGQLLSRIYPGIQAPSKWDLSGTRSYAKPAIAGIAGLGKKKLGKAGPALEKKVLPVETDPVKLVTHCCGLNIMKEGDHPKLKDDSEYPDWLWTLNTGPHLPLDQMDPDTEEYWIRARQISNKRTTNMMRLKKF